MGEKRSVTMTVNGVTKCVAEWAKEYGIEQQTLRARIRRGWSPEQSIGKPVGKQGPKLQTRRRPKSKRGTNPRVVADDLPPTRTLNPDALAEVKARGRYPFNLIYELVYNTGSFTGAELTESVRRLDPNIRNAHNVMNVLRKLGLMTYTKGRKCQITHKRCKVWDVTAARPKPDEPISWAADKLGHNQTKKSNGENAKYVSQRTDAGLADAVWLEAAASDFRMMMGMCDRLGRQYSLACETAVAFLQREARRCEKMLIDGDRQVRTETDQTSRPVLKSVP